jgi:hypothetical protein
MYIEKKNGYLSMTIHFLDNQNMNREVQTNQEKGIIFV